MIEKFFLFFFCFTLTARSLPAVASHVLTSGCQSQVKTGPLWPVNCFSHRSCLRRSHNCTVPFSVTAAKPLGWWGLNWTSRTLSALLYVTQHYGMLVENIRVLRYLTNVVTAVVLEMSWRRKSKHFIVPSWDPESSKLASELWKVTCD